MKPTKCFALGCGRTTENLVRPPPRARHLELLEDVLEMAPHGVGEIQRGRAVSRFVLPAATSLITSRSRGVSISRPGTALRLAARCRGG